MDYLSFYLSPEGDSSSIKFITTTYKKSQEGVLLRKWGKDLLGFFVGGNLIWKK
jgi:hypothetical protein